MATAVIWKNITEEESGIVTRSHLIIMITKVFLIPAITENILTAIRSVSITKRKVNLPITAETIELLRIITEMIRKVQAKNKNSILLTAHHHVSPIRKLIPDW